jgi:hypothetical protein
MSARKNFSKFELEKDFEELPPESFLYDRRGPWPQPSANHPFGEVKAVLHVPFAETFNWWKKVGARYIKDLVFYSPVALAKSIHQGGLKELSDKQFTEYFYHSCYAKYLTAELSESVKTLFCNYINPKKNYHVVDFSAMELLVPINGLHCEKSITLFELHDGIAKPVAINLKDYVVAPTDGDLWMLGKFTAMQGASNHINVAEHPKLHFPMDAINAITKSAVPMEHILFQLLIPHFEITLKLNYQVLNNPTSLLENKWWMIYGPFPATSKSMRDLMVVGYCGIKGNPSYNKYEFPLNGPKKVHSDFGLFHEKYYKAYYNLAKNILSEIPKNDKYVTEWANYIHLEMPSFPNGVEIWKNDNFAKAVGVLLWDLTLGHAVDHKTYSEMPAYWNPMRLRVASPQLKNPDFKFNLKSAVTIIDQTKWIMANRLFYQPWNINNLMDVDYSFKIPNLNEHVKKFKHQMRMIEKNLATRNYMPVDEIPVSIQY